MWDLEVTVKQLFPFVLVVLFAIPTAAVAQTPAPAKKKAPKLVRVGLPDDPERDVLRFSLSARLTLAGFRDDLGVGGSGQLTLRFATSQFFGIYVKFSAGYVGDDVLLNGGGGVYIRNWGDNFVLLAGVSGQGVLDTELRVQDLPGFVADVEARWRLGDWDTQVPGELTPFTALLVQVGAGFGDEKTAVLWAASLGLGLAF